MCRQCFDCLITSYVLSLLLIFLTQASEASSAARMREKLAATLGSFAPTNQPAAPPIAAAPTPLVARRPSAELGASGRGLGGASVAKPPTADSNHNNSRTSRSAAATGSKVTNSTKLHV